MVLDRRFSFPAVPPEGLGEPILNRDFRPHSGVVLHASRHGAYRAAGRSAGWIRRISRCWQGFA